MSNKSCPACTRRLPVMCYLHAWSFSYTCRSCGAPLFVRYSFPVKVFNILLLALPDFLWVVLRRFWERRPCFPPRGPLGPARAARQKTLRLKGSERSAAIGLALVERFWPLGRPSPDFGAAQGPETRLPTLNPEEPYFFSDLFWHLLLQSYGYGLPMLDLPLLTCLLEFRM